MKTKNSHFLISLMMGTGLIMLSSCGGGGGGGGGGGKSTERQRENQNQIETELTGQYRAVLKTINSSVAGTISGSVTLSREDDQLIGYVRFSGLQPNVLHTQHIHIAKACPTTDENGDGFIERN